MPAHSAICVANWSRDSAAWHVHPCPPAVCSSSGEGRSSVQKCSHPAAGRHSSLSPLRGPTRELPALKECRAGRTLPG